MVKRKIQYCFYADDFTGATDALSFLHNAGANVVLFTDVPTAKQLEQFPNCNAIGIASTTRALKTKELEQKLKSDFEKINKIIEPQFFHYKICSTFDSSPTIGNIGKAIEIGLEKFKLRQVSIIGGHPQLGRYCTFGNLFATMGTNPKSKAFRIDKHPSMSKHPSTPATESNLIEMLGKQTKVNIELIDYRTIEKGVAAIKQKETEFTNASILYDAASLHHIETLGNTFFAKQHTTAQFIIGASSVCAAIGTAFNKVGIWKKPNQDNIVSSTKPLLVCSGSCSPIAKKQIAYAIKNGFEEIVIDVKKNIDEKLIIEKLLQGKSVIIHTGKETDKKINAEKLGAIYGVLVKNILQKVRLQRIVFAGGDTSSYAATALGINALSLNANYIAGAPICKVALSAKMINGIEVIFKGGQVGEEDFFTNL